MEHPTTPITDADRKQAMQALGVHVGNATIDFDTFERRCELAGQCVDKTELDSLFVDLPLPHAGTDLTPYIRPDAPPQPAPVSTDNRYRNYLDEPIGNSPITHRKARLIGWILAIAWIPIAGDGLEWLLPDGLEFAALFTPMLLMTLYSIAIQPVKPKVKVMPPIADPNTKRPPKQYPY